MGFGETAATTGLIQQSYGGGLPVVPGTLTASAPAVSSGFDWKGVGSLIGGAAKYAGGYLGAQNQYTAAKAESTMMRSEAELMDYNADLARWEVINADRERDIEIDQHRTMVGEILGKQRTFYAWGNIALDDPEGTPAQMLLRSLYAAEYDEGIIIERGFIKKQQAKGKVTQYEYRASSIRSAIPGVEAGGKLARTAGLLSLSGELLKDTGAISS